MAVIAIFSIAIFPVLFMILYIAIIIYLVWLAGHLVRAVEKIADKIGKSRPPTESENL